MERRSRFILLVVLAALGLRLYRIGAQSLWIDELFSIGKSIPKPGLDIWDYLQYNLQGPFHAFIIYLWHFLSTGDAWLRVPSAIAGAATIYYLYRWAEVWMGERVARWAAVILALHPLHIQYSQELRAYSFVVFFVTFAGYHFHRFLIGEKRKHAAAYVIGTALAVLSSLSAAFFYAAQSIIYLVRRGFGPKRLLRWIAISIAVLALISPWVYRAIVVLNVQALVTPVKPGDIAVEERLRGETTFTPAAVPYVFYVFSTGTSLGPSTRELHFQPTFASILKEHGFWIAWTAAIFGFLSLAGLLQLRRENRERAAAAVLYIAVPLLLVLAVNWQNAKPFNARYVLVSLPVYVCILAAGLHSLTSWWKRGAAALVFITLAVSLGNFYFNQRYWKEDIRGAARLVEVRIQPDECVLSPLVWEVFQYYFKKPNLVEGVWAPPGISRDVLDERLRRRLAGCSGVWFVRAREWDTDPEGKLLETLRGMYGESSETIQLTGVEIIRYGQ